MDRTTGSTSSAEAEANFIMLNEDQMVQLLSAFWVQANLTDNVPSNFEAIAHSFSLTLISSRLKNSSENVIVRLFQLPLSLRTISLDSNYGILPPSCQRSLFTLATAMLMFAAKIFNISDLNELLTSLVCYDIVDPFLSIGEDLQAHVKPQADVGEYGSVTDDQSALRTLCELREGVFGSRNAILDILVRSLSGMTELDTDSLAQQLSEVFTPDDAFLFGPQSVLDSDHLQMIACSKESLSFDEEFQAMSTIEDDAVTQSSVTELSCSIPKLHTTPSLSHIISAGQLIDSALEVAGQVASTAISTSPLPYSAMARQCEALGVGTRKKLSSWLAYETTQDSNSADNLSENFRSDGLSAIRKIMSNGEAAGQGGSLSTGPWSAMRLPPASPFDNFLKAARS